eukprot:SAG11_NODE_25306_length_360_cov_1.808429_2_plen_61_part_01
MLAVCHLRTRITSLTQFANWKGSICLYRTVCTALPGTVVPGSQVSPNSHWQGSICLYGSTN